MDIVTSQLLRSAVPLFKAMAVAVLLLSVSAILYLGQEIFVPFALGILLSFVLAPIVTLLQRWHVPRMLAITGAILAACAIIVVIFAIVASQIAALAGNLPGYRLTMQTKLESFSADTGEPQGPFGRAAEALSGIISDVQNIGETPEAESAEAQREAGPQPLRVQVVEQSGALAVASSVISPLLGPLATIGVVIVFAIFILLQREDLRNRFIRLAGSDDLQKTTAAIDDGARRVSRLLLFQSAVNAGFGLITGIGLMVIGVPSPFLWGILGGILRFIPYVGGFIGAGLPMALAFAVDPGWSMLIWTAILFIAAETLLSNVVEPVLYGHSTGLSPVAILIAALVWALLWGPVGLILATPLTICLVVLGRHVPRLGFIDVMFGDRPALSPPQIFYQRMLAGAPQEAALQAREFLKNRALATYYDEVALEGLRLAHEDVSRFAVEGERLETLRGATLDLVGRLDAIRSPLPSGSTRQVRAEAAAAIDAAGPDRETARVVRRPSELAPAFRTETPVVCIAGAGALDEPIGAMLSQVLTKHGLPTRLVPLADIEDRDPSPQDVDGVALVCLSFLEPLSTVHLRLAIRRVHRVAPDARILLCIWRQRDPAMIETLKTKVRADALATTVNSALAAALAISSIGGTTSAGSKAAVRAAA